ncbi:hypothetical protein ACK83U_00825 [Rhizobium sp. WW22]|uniref:hypothetical protein n=1 Tax=Rhizobium sp. WW22 TaxID=3389070 RepID=UPI00399A893D
MFTLRMLWGRQAFCGPESEQCLREWASALSGWVGGAAAIATILVISNHHRENVKLQNFPVFRTARLAKQSATQLKMLCGTLRGSANRDAITAIQISVKEIAEILSGNIITDFELRIGVDDASGLIEAKSLIGAILQTLTDRPKPDPFTHIAIWTDNGPVKEGARRVAHLVLEYAESLDTSASAYIAQYSNA